MDEDEEVNEVNVPVARITVEEMRAVEDQVRTVMQFIPIKEKHVLFDRDEPVQHRVRINGTVSRTEVAEETLYRLSEMTLSRGDDLRFSVVQEGSTDTHEWILHADITHKSKLDQSGNVVETKETTLLPWGKVERLGVLIQFYTDKSTCQFQKLTIKGYPPVWTPGQRLSVAQLALELPHNENINTVLFNIFRSIRRTTLEEVSLNVSAATFVRIGKDKLLKRPALHLILEKFHIQAFREIQTKWCSVSINGTLKTEEWKELLEYYLTKKQAGWYLQIEFDSNPYVALHQLCAKYKWELRRFKDKVCLHQIARNDTEVVVYFNTNHVVLETVNPGVVGKPLPKRFNLEIMNKIIAYLPIIERDMIKNDLFWEAGIPSVHFAIAVNFNALTLDLDKNIDEFDSELETFRRFEILLKHPKTITENLVIYGYSEHFLYLPNKINVRRLLLVHYDPYPKEFFEKFNKQDIRELCYTSMDCFNNAQDFIANIEGLIDISKKVEQIEAESWERAKGGSQEEQIQDEDEPVDCNYNTCIHSEELDENAEVHSEDNPEVIHFTSDEPIDEEHDEQEQLEESPRKLNCICDTCVKQTTIDEPQENPEGYNEANTETYAPTFAHDLDRSRSPTPVYTRSGSPWLEELQSDEPCAKRSRLEQSDESTQPRYHHKGSKSLSPQRRASSETNFENLRTDILNPMESPVPTPEPASPEINFEKLLAYILKKTLNPMESPVSSPEPSIPELIDVDLMDLELPTSIPRFLEKSPVFTQQHASPELFEDHLGTLVLELPTCIPRFIEEPPIPRQEIYNHQRSTSIEVCHCFSPVYRKDPEEEYWEHWLDHSSPIEPQNTKF